MTLTVFAGLVAVAMLSAAGIAAGAAWFLSGHIDSSRTEVLTRVDRLDSKNEAAHAGIVTRVDALAHDVAFLAGRQKERDQRANRPDEGQ